MERGEHSRFGILRALIMHIHIRSTGGDYSVRRSSSLPWAPRDSGLHRPRVGIGAQGISQLTFATGGFFGHERRRIGNRRVWVGIKSLEKPRFISFQITREQFSLRGGGITIAMNNLAENGFVYSHRSCELILMTAAPEYLEFKVRKHRFYSCPESEW